MKKTTIRDLPISYYKEYLLTIDQFISHSSMIVIIMDKRFCISIPKNLTWSGINLYQGMTCVIKKVQYGDSNQYSKLNFIRLFNNEYYGDEDSYTGTDTCDETNKYYVLLECDIYSSLDTIKKNYRRIIRSYHYDTLASKGLPEDMLDYAQEKAKKLNDAYEHLKKSF